MPPNGVSLPFANQADGVVAAGMSFANAGLCRNSTAATMRLASVTVLSDEFDMRAVGRRRSTASGVRMTTRPED